MATLADRDTPTRAGKAGKDPEAAAGGVEGQVHFVHHSSFSRPDVAGKLWGPRREEIRIEPYDLPPEVGGERKPAPRKVASLTAEQERTLFLRYNYAKYRLNRLAGMRSTPARRKQQAMWRRRALSAREAIIEANLPLAPAMAGRKHVEGVEFADKVAEGYLAIMRSVEYFDVSRGFKFSTYACRAILAALFRLGSKTQTYRKHVPVSFEPSMEQDDASQRRVAQQRDDAIDAVRRVLRNNDADLDEAQQEVIRRRFSLEGGGKPEARWKVGRALGVSTEQVRRIEAASLDKLQQALMQC